MIIKLLQHLRVLMTLISTSVAFTGVLFKDPGITNAREEYGA